MALAKAFARLPETMRKTLTWDLGTEMTRHAEFTWASGVPVYFCDAYCPWQRGSNENTAAPVPPEEDRPLPAHPRAGARRRRQAQPSTTPNTQMADSTRGLPSRERSDDRLKPLPRGQFHLPPTLMGGLSHARRAAIPQAQTPG